MIDMFHHFSARAVYVASGKLIYNVVPPERYKLVNISPSNHGQITTINHSNKLVINQLNAIKRGPHIVSMDKKTLILHGPMVTQLLEALIGERVAKKSPVI